MTARTVAPPAVPRSLPAVPESAAGGLSVAVCRDPDRFARLAPEWTDLYRRCRSATPFQTHGWLHSWWLSYGIPGRLRLILVRRGDGRLVGVAPLMLTYRPLPALVPLGGDISDFFDVLLDDGCADTATAALTAGLGRAARRAVVDLREVRPGAAAERVFDLWAGPRHRLEDSVCLELPGIPMDRLLERMPGPSARRTRAKLRKLDSLGVAHRTVPAYEVPEAVATMLRLHALQWQRRGGTPEHSRPRFAEHLVRALREMVAAGDAQLTEYRIGERVLAVDVNLISADLAGGYLYGAHPDLRARGADLSTMLLRRDAAFAAETGRGVVSLLRGDEAYKRHWRPVVVTNQRLLLARPELGSLLVLHAAQAASRPRLAEAVRTRLPALLAWRARLNSWRAVAYRIAG